MARPITAAVAPPPGQLALWPTAPATRPTSLRIRTRTRVSPAIRNLPVAALQADAAATSEGEAWLLAADGTWARVDRTGSVEPSTGWAALAARVIASRRSSTS